MAVGYTELKPGGNNVAPAGSAMFSYRNAEGVLVSEAGVAAVRPIKRGRIFVGNDLLFEGYTGGDTKDFVDGLVSTGDIGWLDEASPGPPHTSASQSSSRSRIPFPA